MALRDLIFIEADNPDVCLIAFLSVGMAEVVVCDIRVSEGQVIIKGVELGIFHFGGSTKCFFFRPSVKLDFDLYGQ